ncbi:hypothetical protein JG687_00017248 [Phytophthora cactorum]|uniref:Uncharacterized protein n=1 Tax=Phytophthora cactorum TaxID=29920 RepID=A0A8T1TTR0_9STRA|nr:hypothetical protein JG687_00017248 [Phytophthora cactorum]
MPAPLGKPVLRARDLSFRSVWKELKANGWTSKNAPSRSLDDGANPNKTEGLDFFLEPDAVLKFYAQGETAAPTTPQQRPNHKRLDPEATASSPAATDPPRTPSIRARGMQQRSPRSRPPSSRRLLIATSPHVSNSTYDDTADDTGDDLDADDYDSVDWTGDSAEEGEVQVGWYCCMDGAYCAAYCSASVMRTVLYTALHTDEV